MPLFKGHPPLLKRGTLCNLGRNLAQGLSGYFNIGMGLAMHGTLGFSNPQKKNLVFRP